QTSDQGQLFYLFNLEGRMPTCSASASSLAERLTSMRKPASEKRAPAFLATEWATCRSPRVTSTSVTASLSDLCSEIAARCCWLCCWHWRRDRCRRAAPTR